jgi:hypothetical protein
MPVDTTALDISKYKCVPLDLLKNVSKDNQIQFNVTNNDVSLKDLKEQQSTDVATAAPKSPAMSAATVENYIVYAFVALIVMLLVAFLFNGMLLFKTVGFKGFFSIPESLRGLPIIGLTSILFFITGFVIGFFARN